VKRVVDFVKAKDVLPGKAEPGCPCFTQSLWPRPGSYRELQRAWNHSV